MNPKRLILLLSLTTLALFTYGCADQEDSVPADVAEIQDVINDDTDGLFGIDMAAEEDSSDVNTNISKTTGEINTKAFWRRVNVRRTGLNVVKIGEDTAIATITFRMRGHLVIRARIGDSGAFARYFKPMDHSFQRKVRFVRNTIDSTTYWHRDGITPAYGVSANGTLSLTNPIVISINRNDTLHTITINDPTTHFFKFSNLPKWGPGDIIKIEVPIANSNALDLPVGSAHRGRYGNILSRQRAPFHDDGLNGDAVASDGIYTAQWTAVNTTVTGPHLGILDFFSHSAIYTDSEPYNSLAVMLPFIKLAD